VLYDSYTFCPLISFYFDQTEINYELFSMENNILKDKSYNKIVQSNNFLIIRIFSFHFKNLFKETTAMAR